MDVIDGAGCCYDVDGWGVGGRCVKVQKRGVRELCANGREQGTSRS